MLKPANPLAKDCYERAFEARERGTKASDPAARHEFFESEARWLKLAQSYEFSDRLSQFLAGHNLPNRPACPNCAVPMWLVKIGHGPTTDRYQYECKACGHAVSR